MCQRQGCGPAGGLVTVFEPSGRVVAHEDVLGDHGFRFELPPGRYELNAGKLLKYDYPFNCPPRTVQVRPGRTTRVNVEEDCGVI